MTSLTSLTGQSQKVTIGDETIEIHPLTINDLGGLQKWVDDQFPCPIALAKAAIDRGNFNVAQQQYLLKTALEQASRPKHLIGTPEADALLFSTEGIKQVMLLAIRKGDPGFPEERIAEVVAAMNQIDISRTFAATGLDMVAADPKAPTPPDARPSKPSGSTTSRRDIRAASK